MKIFWDRASQAEWERLADKTLAGMHQRWIYGAVHHALGGTTHRAVIRDNGNPVALCQCICRRFGGFLNISLTSIGPLWLAQCDRAAAIALIRRTLPLPRPRLQLLTLTGSPPTRRLVPLVGPATMAMRDLPAPAQSLQGKWRNILKKAEKNNLDIRHQRCSPIALRELLAHDAQQQKVRAYRALPAAFTHEWQRLAPDDLRLFTAHEAGHILAQALFLRHGNTATYHIAHISERGRATSAARLLLWRSFQDFTAEGLARIDLGRIDPENAPGLARFKMGTGAKACTTGPTVLAL